jgi:O-antigen ligase
MGSLLFTSIFYLFYLFVTFLILALCSLNFAFKLADKGFPLPIPLIFCVISLWIKA